MLKNMLKSEDTKVSKNYLVSRISHSTGEKTLSSLGEGLGRVSSMDF
jgi:hypothetical protein